MNTRTLWLLLVIAAASCKNGGEKKPDISNIKAEVRINRFDRDFFSIDTLQTTAAVNSLFRRHPQFAQQYFDYYTPIGQLVAGGLNRDVVVNKFINDLKPLYDSVSTRFQNLATLEKELSLAFRYAQHYFPGFKVPAVYTTVEGLSPDDPEEIYGAIFFRDTLSISLQMYAGAAFSGYDPKYYHEYLRRRFVPEYIPRNAMRAIVLARYPEKPALTLVNQMVEAGRRLYLVRQLLPDTPEEIVLGYTKEQMKFCRAQEKAIWTHFLNNQLLYSDNPAINREYVGEGPFTKDIEGAPGNIGAFTGLQIVKKYMKKNPSVSLPQLMDADPGEIFSEANYKPD